MAVPRPQNYLKISALSTYATQTSAKLSSFNSHATFNLLWTVDPEVEQQIYADLKKVRWCRRCH